eukprot:4208560-Pyramimonas_sp.AAC.1
MGIFSRRTNQTQEAWVYSHDGPITTTGPNLLGVAADSLQHGLTAPIDGVQGRHVGALGGSTNGVDGDPRRLEGSDGPEVSEAAIAPTR